MRRDGSPVLAPFLSVRPFTTRLPSPLPRSYRPSIAASGNAVVPARPRSTRCQCSRSAMRRRRRARQRRVRRPFTVRTGTRQDAGGAGGPACCDPADGAPAARHRTRPERMALARAVAPPRVHACIAQGHVCRHPAASVSASPPPMRWPEGYARRAVLLRRNGPHAFARSHPCPLCITLTASASTDRGRNRARVRQTSLRHLPWRALRVAVRPTQDEVLALL